MPKDKNIHENKNVSSNCQFKISVDWFTHSYSTCVPDDDVHSYTLSTYALRKNDNMKNIPIRGPVPI